MWVRGLKQWNKVCRFKGRKSHPMWVRGLKLNVTVTKRKFKVAPHVCA